MIFRKHQFKEDQASNDHPHDVHFHRISTSGCIRSLLAMLRSNEQDYLMATANSWHFPINVIKNIH